MRRTPHRTHAKASLTAAVALSLLLAACGGGGGDSSTSSAADLTAPAKKEGTLVFLEKWPDPRYAPYFDKVVADYMAANPGVKIDHQSVGDQPYKDKIRVLTAAKKLPDVYFAWAGDFAGKFVRANLAADLSPVLDGTEWGKSFAPSALKAYQYDGKYYGVPIDLDSKVFAYSKAAFEKAGVNPPTSLTQLLESCDKLSAAGYTPIAFGNQFGWPAIHYMTQLNAQEVPADVRAKDYDPKTGDFSHPGYVKALKDLQQINDRCLTKKANGISHEAAQATLLNGKAAMQYIESVEFDIFKEAPAELKAAWDFFPMPPIDGAEGNQTALTGAPNGFLVNAQSKNKPLAIDFLKFLTSLDNAKQETKQLNWLSPVIGSTTAENSTPQLQKALKTIQGASELAIWLDTVTSSEVANAYLAGVQGLLDGSKTPESIMTDVQAAAKKAKSQVGG